MSNVFNRVTPEYKISVHTPDFNPANWAINPDVTGVGGNPIRFWFLTGATNAEGLEIIGIVDAPTQASIDAALDAARVVAQKASAKNSIDVERVLRALVDLLPSEFNILRTLHSLPDRTSAGLITAIKANIDAAP